MVKIEFGKYSYASLARTLTLFPKITLMTSPLTSIKLKTLRFSMEQNYMGNCVGKGICNLNSPCLSIPYDRCPICQIDYCNDFISS